MAEARNLRNMSMQQTPLYGEENTPLHGGDGGTGYEGATPRHHVAFTPNPLTTPRTGRPGDPGATPLTQNGGIPVTPLRTPLRDNLSINPEDYEPRIGDTAREQRLRAKNLKSSLQAGFESLPKPENNFELLIPEDEEDNDTRNPTILREDAAERDARVRRLQEEESLKALARRSQVVQLTLPRPPNVDFTALLAQLSVDDGDDQTQRLIHTEIAYLMQHDAIAYPIPGTTRPGGSISNYEIPADADVESAKAQIHAELGSALGFPSAEPAQLREGLLALCKSEDVSDEASWSSVRRSLVYNASTLTWVDAFSLSAEERAAGYEAQLAEVRDSMLKSATKAGKAEKRLGIQLGGFQARSGVLNKRITDAFDSLVKIKVEYESFSALKANESITAPRRVTQLKGEVETLETRERRLQERYKELEDEKDTVQSRVEALEERLMLEAEALNEAAMAQ